MLIPVVTGSAVRNTRVPHTPVTRTRLTRVERPNYAARMAYRRTDFTLVGIGGSWHRRTFDEFCRPTAGR